VAFNLPEVTSPLVHTIVMKEWEDEFAPRSSVQHAPPGRDEVQLRESDALLRVMLVAQLWPAVLRHRPPAVRLRPGEWVRWQITYRRASFLGRGPWYYKPGHPESGIRHGDDYGCLPGHADPFRRRAHATDQIPPPANELK
jgi:hypothetical protein